MSAGWQYKIYLYLMLESQVSNSDIYGLFRAAHSHNPTQYSHIVGLSSHFYAHIGAGCKVFHPPMSKLMWVKYFAALISYILRHRENVFNVYVHLFMIFSTFTSTRTASGPIQRTQENGMTYSISRPKKQNSFPGPGTISDLMQPVHSLNSTSATQPKILQSQVLITCLLCSSQIRIKTPPKSSVLLYAKISEKSLKL